MKKTFSHIISSNRKANFKYEILNNYETGIELKGTEVKSLRNSSTSLQDSYCVIQKGEIFIFNMYIAPYEHGNIFNENPTRKRKLLMHKKEILKLYDLVRQKGFSLIPISIYFKGRLIKLKIALCKGKKNYDKRLTIAKREAKIKIERTLKQNKFYNMGA